MTNEPVVLAVDDDVSIRNLIKLALTDQGFHVITAGTAAAALEIAERERPDLVVLDITLPDASGLELLNRLRETRMIPVILLTAHSSERDRVIGLESGADDYVVKPFSLDELAARVRAVLRRIANPAGMAPTVEIGDIIINLDRRTVTKAGDTVALTRNEWLLLQIFAAHAGKVLLNDELLTKVWGPEFRGDAQYLRVWISRLRHKIETDSGKPLLIQTVPGIGYLMVAPNGEGAVQAAS